MSYSYIVNDAGEFWSNEWGWTGFDEADLYEDYDRNEPRVMPDGGRWEEAKLLTEAQAAKLSGANRLEAACEIALEALYNAPCVGDVYDQQHSDTHIRAILALREALGMPVT